MASLGAATAYGLPWLLFFRVQQAVARGIALPNGAALLREVVPAERRAGRCGLVGAASGVLSTSRYLGSIVGSGALAGFLGPADDGVTGFAGVFLVAAAAALLSALAGLALQEKRG